MRARGRVNAGESGPGVRNTILVSLLSQGLGAAADGAAGGATLYRPNSALAVILHFGFVPLLKTTVTRTHLQYRPCILAFTYMSAAFGI